MISIEYSTEINQIHECHTKVLAGEKLFQIKFNIVFQRKFLADSENIYIFKFIIESSNLFNLGKSDFSLIAQSSS